MSVSSARSVFASPGALVVLLGLIHFVIPLTFVLGGPAKINAYLTNDDTYYYLQTAWNARHLGFVTFDGINRTNGVQFLWFSLLYLLSFVTTDKATFLNIAFEIALLLTCVPYVVIWRIFSRTPHPHLSYLALMVATLWFIVSLYPPDRYLVGLESPLHACIIWMLVLQYIRIYRQAASGLVSSATVLLFVCLLVLNTWTRLDSVGLSASFLVLLLLTVPRSSGPTLLRRPLASGLPTATYAAAVLIIVAGGAAQFVFFELAGNSLLPVSALVKDSQADYFSLGAFYNWSLVLFPVRVSGANLLNTLGIVAMFGSLGVVLRMRPQPDEHDGAAFRFVAMALGTSVVIHSVITFGMFRYYYFWYLSGTFVYWVLLLPLLALSAIRRKGWDQGVFGIVGLVLALTMVGIWWLRVAPDRLATTRYEAARWMNANLEKNAIVGSFNSGQLAYFSDRSVVNLDGLVNHVSYFENVIRAESPAALGAYMDRIGLDYIADYQFGRWQQIIDERFTTVREFDLGNGGAIKLMARKHGEAPSGR